MNQTREGRRRVLAMVTLTAVVGAVVGIGGYASASRSRQPTLHVGERLPLELDALFSPGAPRRWGGGLASVVLYASQSCSHCHAELQRWADLAQRRPDLFAQIDVVVVAGATSGAGAWVPAGLPHRYVVDSTRTIASQLGVRLVPYTVYLDGSGHITHLVSGEQPARATLKRLESLTLSAEEDPNVP